MEKKCQITRETFQITEQELILLKKMGLKIPNYSPKIREICRFMFRNDRNLSMRKCDATGEKILSIYSADKDFAVYKYDYWVSDKWDAPILDYDPNKSFFEQYKELSKKTPRPSLFAPYNENCDYVNAAEKNKNCFMHILSDRCEDCYYTHGIFASRDCIDSTYLHNCELCYEANDCKNCYHCRMIFLSDNCSDCSFCFDMRGCKNCFMSYGLRNQEYCFENKQLTKSEYEEKIKAINLGSYEEFGNYKNRFISEILSKQDYIRMINNENSDGNFLINTRNCHKCYDVEGAEDCFSLRIGANGIKDVHHSYAIVDNSELIYANISTTESYNCHNIVGCWTTKNSAYGEFLQGCESCLGCISLKYKKYCILNKEYSKEEYEKIKENIIKELGEKWGDPFPIGLGTFSYLESAYSDYHHMTKEEVEKIGWVYGEEEEEKKGDFPSASNLPDDIKTSNYEQDGSKIYSCETTKKPFKIIKQEFDLLKRINAPLPRKHHEQRFKDRVKFRMKFSGVSG